MQHRRVLGSCVFAATLWVGCGGSTNGASVADASPPDDASAPFAPSDAASPDALEQSDGSTPSPSALGTVTSVTDGDCGGAGGGICKLLTVTCAGIDAATATLKIDDPGNATRTVAILGPGGGTAFYDKVNLVSRYTEKGFRVVQIKWPDDWEYSATGTGTKAAACRPATVFRWIFDNLHQGGASHPYCVHGSSGGAGALGYALVNYGLSTIIDFAVMSFGPVFSEIQYGCDPSLYTGAARNLCPELPSAPFTYNDNSNRVGLNRWEGTSTCVTGPASPTDIAKWTADSIDTDADFAMPRTGTAYYYCSQPANAGAGLGSFFIDKANAATKSVTCFADCASEDLTAQDVAKIVDDADVGCVTRH